MAPRPRTRLVAVALATVGLVAACGGGDDSSSGSATPTTARAATAAPAGSVSPTAPPSTIHVTPDAPSAQSRMVCEAAEVQAGVEYYAGEKVTAKPVTTWADRTYTCPYVLPDGTLTLSVKELDDLAATESYFERLRTSLGDTGKVYLGQDGFSTPNGSVVVRKDNLVLLVDDTKLAAHPSPRSPGEIAVNVATIVMSCWTGE